MRLCLQPIVGGDAVQTRNLPLPIVKSAACFDRTAAVFYLQFSFVESGSRERCVAHYGACVGVQSHTPRHVQLTLAIVYFSLRGKERHVPNAGFKLSTGVGIYIFHFGKPKRNL